MGLVRLKRCELKEIQLSFFMRILEISAIGLIILKLYTKGLTSILFALNFVAMDRALVRLRSKVCLEMQKQCLNLSRNVTKLTKIVFF